MCVLADGSRIETPIAKVNVNTPYFVGEVNAWCVNASLYHLIIGNIQQARDPNDQGKDWKRSCVNAVVTRQQGRKKCTKTKPLPVPEIIGSDVRPENILKAQVEDETLRKIRSLVERQPDDSKGAYVRKKGLLYREFHSEKVENGKKFTQLVVPKKY